MKKLYTFNLWDLAHARCIKEVLFKEGIDCLIRNENLTAAMGEIPLTECFPELWVIDDETYPRAKLLLDGWLKNEEASSGWVCPDCGERLEGHFGACWQCGKLQQD